MTRREPAASSDRNSSAAAARDPQPALDDDEVQARGSRCMPDQAELLAERREREVRVDRPGSAGCPSIVGRPAPRPVAEQPAAGERVQRLDDLVAGCRAGRERVEPDVDAGLDVGEEQVHQARAGDEQEEPDDDVADPAGRDVEQRQEHGEEEERRAEVALDDDDAEGDRPHRDHRGEVRQRRQPDRPDLGSTPRRGAAGSPTGSPARKTTRITLSSSDGWPLTGPIVRRQALAVDVVAEHERRAAAGRRRRPPTCTCRAAARHRADGDREGGGQAETTGPARPAGCSPRPSVPKAPDAGRPGPGAGAPSAAG